MDGIKDKTIVITGGGGTIGVPLARKLLEYGAKTIRLLDQDDSALTFAFDNLDHDKRIRLFLGKVEDKERLIKAFSGADIVFHLAAIKHVMIAEYNPFDTISTNVVATQNVIDAALQQNVSKVIFSSSDKAVNPPNTYGSTKLLGEKLMIAANLSKGPRDCLFASVRFGNVIGSRGSVIPRFKKQLAHDNKILVTKKDMTRFIMMQQDAVDLLIKACNIAEGGEVFVLKMVPIKLGDLSDLVLEHFKDQYPNAIAEEIGLFEGEKEFEELINFDDELQRTYDLGEMFVILPKYRELQAKYGKYELNQNKEIIKENLSSALVKPISKEELRTKLNKHKIL